MRVRACVCAARSEGGSRGGRGAGRTEVFVAVAPSASGWSCCCDTNSSEVQWNASRPSADCGDTGRGGVRVQGCVRVCARRAARAGGGAHRVVLGRTERALGHHLAAAYTLLDRDGRLHSKTTATLLTQCTAGQQSCSMRWPRWWVMAGWPAPPAGGGGRRCR